MRESVEAKIEEEKVETTLDDLTEISSNGSPGCKVNAAKNNRAHAEKEMADSKSPE